MCTVLVHLLHLKYCMNIHYLPCNVWNNATFRSGDQENQVFRVYACQWLGPSIIEKLYEKMVLCSLYKGASMDPSWMHAKKNYQKMKKEKIDVLLLFSNSAASQRCRKFGNSNFLFVNMQQPFKLVRRLDSAYDAEIWQHVSILWKLEHTVLRSPCWISSKHTFSVLVVCWEGAFEVGQRKFKELFMLFPVFSELHHWNTRRSSLRPVSSEFPTEDWQWNAL